MNSKAIKFIKEWFLVIGMTLGVLIYLAYDAMPSLHSAGPTLLRICHIAQPVMLFLMLFLSFCKIHPKELKPHRWQIWLLLIQTVSFVALALLIRWSDMADGSFAALISDWKLPIEAAMLCMICPTATACAVMTGKLGGNVAEVVMYTILINFAVALVIPAIVPLLYPESGVSFISAFLKILAKVFPLLIMPFVSAVAVRFLTPKFHSWLLSKTEWSFYIWGVSLTLAITMSTREIVHCQSGIGTLLAIALASLITCIIQFGLGKVIGKRYGSAISATQALGQKNTVFAIWVGYTFLSPIVSVAGGFYSLWHNVYNSWQLYRHEKELSE